MKIKYRKLKLSDADKIRVWRNKQLKVLRQNKIIKKQDQFKYFKNYILTKNPKIHLFAIELNHKLIGYGGLVNISNDFKTAEVSFLVNDKINHNSLLYETIFDEFLFFIKKYSIIKKLRRLYTETFSFRKKHIKILENFGFELEGIMKMHIVKNKKTYDSLIHGIINKNTKNLLNK